MNKEMITSTWVTIFMFNHAFSVWPGPFCLLSGSHIQCNECMTQHPALLEERKERYPSVFTLSPIFLHIFNDS